MQVAVVGHVEWVEFLDVDAAPRPGRILHAEGSWEEPAGGGGVAAVELARLAGRSTLFTGLGDDRRGEAVPSALAPWGVDVRGVREEGPHRRATTLLDPDGERTIVVVGPSQQGGPLDPAVLAPFDAVYFCKGDAAMLQAARAARVLVATARVLPIVREAGVRLDALVASAVDPAEAYAPGDLATSPDLVCITEGAAGGRWSRGADAGRWSAAALPGPVADAYGCGDSFAAGLTYALGSGLDVSAALELAASRGALALTRPGAHGARGRPPGA
jgi:ribokinase